MHRLMPCRLQDPPGKSTAVFSFKQFTVQQNKCAMKVCTDACLFGAWTAEQLSSNSPKRILDIGTGTGLLALMMAQQTDAMIDAVEINADAALQASENFLASPWANRLRVIHERIQAFHSPEKYDLIICNPPFFVNDLEPADKAKKQAMHATSLRLEELFIETTSLLSPTGTLAILLPFHLKDKSIALAKTHGIFLSNLALVRQTPRHDYFRAMMLFSTKPTDTQEETIIIYDEQREYTSRFRSLLNAYYLKL